MDDNNIRKDMDSRIGENLKKKIDNKKREDNLKINI